MLPTQTDKAGAPETQKQSQQLYRVESTIPCGGRFERHTLKEWKRIYGYEFGHPFVKLVQD